MAGGAGPAGQSGRGWGGREPERSDGQGRTAGRGLVDRQGGARLGRAVASRTTANAGLERGDGPRAGAGPEMTARARWGQGEGGSSVASEGTA